MLTPERGWMQRVYSLFLVTVSKVAGQREAGEEEERRVTVIFETGACARDSHSHPARMFLCLLLVTQRSELLPITASVMLRRHSLREEREREGLGIPL